MSSETLFRIQLVLGYVAWLLCFNVYIWPKLKAANRFDAHRAIATLHSFRFFGLVFILPGVVGPGLPAGFATFAAYGDFATGVLALLALLTARIRPLFWSFVVAFNLVGTIDLIVDYYHATVLGLSADAGQLGATYPIPIIYVPLLMITHVTAFYLLLRPRSASSAQQLTDSKFPRRTTMTETINKIREHYSATGLTDRIKAALSSIAPESQALTVAQLDQFHTRGILATAELARAAGIDPSTRALDLGCGIGGPARYLAATFGCKVTGIDLSPSFIDAATWLTARCGLSDRATFQVGNALHLPSADGAFDVVFLQHVAMNVKDRGALYGEVRRILAPGGRFVTYDLVLRHGDVLYPVPWARDASASFLLSESETRTALERAGYNAVLWRDDTEAARDWFRTVMSAEPQSGPNLGLVMGPDFPAMTGNLARNLRENRLGVLSAVLNRD